MLKNIRAKFGLGQIVHHTLFDYRGVIIDVDPCYQGTEDWYQRMAPSEPPRDEPWYHVLVDNAEYGAYVAERNLELDNSGKPINHPQIELYFEKFNKGGYKTLYKHN